MRITRGRSIALPLAAWLVAAVCAFAQGSGPQTTTSYHDAKSGVRFDFPASWNLDSERAFYLPPAILSPDRLQLASAGFGGSEIHPDRPFPGTNLSGVEFLYVVLPGTSKARCDSAFEAGEDAKVTRETIHGVAYRQVSFGDAGLCHQASHEVYSANLGGRCYLFEAVIQTTCPGSEATRRDLTGPEFDGLQLQLRQIMHSVQIANPGAKSP